MYVSTGAAGMPTGKNISTRSYMMKGMPWSAPMHGWTATVRC